METPMKKLTFPVAAALAAVALASCSTQSPQTPSPSPETTPTPFVAENGDAWMQAINGEDLDALGTLVEESGALAIIDGRTALQIAADAANAEAVALLVDAGADLDARDTRERTAWTALHFAANSDCGPCVATLIAAGADSDAKDRFQPGRAPIHVAASVGATEALTALLDAGIEVDSFDNGSGHALMWAAYYGQTEAAQVLLDRGADPTIVDGSGNNASTRAAGQGHEELAALLAEAIEGWDSGA
jgi:ankyrin repeat protein